MQFKTGYDFKNHSRSCVHFDEPTRTKQYFKDECDVNNILSKYMKTGLIDHVSQYNGRYGDFATFEDYHSSMNKISEARACFDSLPSDLRARFSNDPAQFLDFVQNPANVNEMVTLGLATKREAPAVTPD